MQDVILATGKYDMQSTCWPGCSASEAIQCLSSVKQRQVRFHGFQGSLPRIKNRCDGIASYWRNCEDCLTCMQIQYISWISCSLYQNVFSAWGKKLIAKQSTWDPVLSKVLRYLAMGWPDTIKDDLRPYLSRRDELTLEKGCIIWGTGVVNVIELRRVVLQILHNGHICINCED